MPRNNLFLLSSFLLLNLSVGGQTRNTSNSFQAQCIQGEVMDSTTQKPLGMASLEFIFQTADQTPLTTLTDSNGRFRICVSKPLKFLNITQVGFKEKTIQIPVSSDSVIQLSFIGMYRSVVNLPGAIVTIKKESEPITIEKKTYSVSQNILATGGTAIDALKQIPAVNVDNDGNISLRGSNNITIYINGKQSSLSGADRQALLLQIPAANIESIEVNTNPGAKQDAEGQSGIINITLKHNTAKNKNGYITLGAGTHNKYNGNASFNTSYKRFGFSNTLSFRQNDQWGRGYNLRTNYLNGTTNHVNQFSNGEYLTYNGTLSGNIDYNHSKKLIISSNYLVSRNMNTEQELTKSNLSDEADSLYQLIHRHSAINGQTDNIDAGLSMRKTFDKPTHNLIAMVNYSATATDNSTEIKQDELSTLSEQIKSQFPYLLYLDNKNRFSNRLLQLDYTRLLPKNIKLETGLKYTGRRMDNNFMVDSFNHSLQLEVKDNGKSNHFIYDENVSATYLMLSQTVNPLIKYNAGLRLENTGIAGEQLSTGEKFNYSYAKIFPSGSINFQLQKKYKLPDVQLSYSKRINRPGQGQLNPFINYADPYNLSRGNPNLKPELTDAIELSTLYDTKKAVFTATLYARQTRQPISRFRTIDSNGISTVNQVNLDYNRSTGGEVVARFNLMKDLKVTLNGNLYKYIVSGNVVGNDFINKRVSYSGKANLNYQFWKKTDVQASFSYMGPFVTPQGTLKPMFGLEIGGKKDIIKDKFSISLNLADVFNNRRFAMTMTDPVFTSSFYRKRESRILTFNMTWKFGNIDSKATEKKPKQQEQSMPMDF